jgi:hypothetical protein
MLGLLFSVTFVIGYLVTVRSGVGIDTLVFAGIVLTSFVALTDRAREGVMSKAAERVSDASAFGCVFLGFLCSSMTATSSIQSRCLLIAVAVASLFLDEDGFADTGATEEAYFSSLDDRGEKVDHFNAGFKDFCFRGLFGEWGSRAVDWEMLFKRLLYGRKCVTGYIKEVAQGLRSYGDFDHFSVPDSFGASFESVSRVHGDGADVT